MGRYVQQMQSQTSSRTHDGTDGRPAQVRQGQLHMSKSGMPKFLGRTQDELHSIGIVHPQVDGSSATLGESAESAHTKQGI